MTNLFLILLAVVSGVVAIWAGASYLKERAWKSNGF